MHWWCPWCENSGWVYLRRFTARKMRRFLRKTKQTVEHRWAEQVLAPCIVCERGERNQRKYPAMPVQYELEDIDITLDDHTLAKMGEGTVDRYLHARQDPERIVRAQAAAMADDAPDVLEYLPTLNQDQDQARLPVRATGLISPPTTPTRSIQDP